MKAFFISGSFSFPAPYLSCYCFVSCAFNLLQGDDCYPCQFLSSLSCLVGNVSTDHWLIYDLSDFCHNHLVTTTFIYVFPCVEKVSFQSQSHSGHKNVLVFLHYHFLFHCRGSPRLFYCIKCLFQAWHEGLTLLSHCHVWVFSILLFLVGDKSLLFLSSSLSLIGAYHCIIVILIVITCWSILSYILYLNILLVALNVT